MHFATATTIVVALVLSGVAYAAADPTSTCTAAKLTAAGKKTDSLLSCHAKAAEKGEAVDPKCTNKAEDSLITAFTKAEAAAVKKGGLCPTVGDAATVEADVDAFVGDVVTALRPSQDASKCVAVKLSAVGNEASVLLKAYAKNVKRPGSKQLSADIANAQAAFSKAFDKAEALKNGGCLTTGDGTTISEDTKAFVKNILADLKTFTDMIFKEQKIPGPPEDATLNGALSVSSDGKAEGQVVVSFGSGGTATIVAGEGTLKIHVGGSILDLLPNNFEALSFDGALIPMEEVIDDLNAAFQSDPSQWSAMQRALFAFTTLVSTESWQANVRVAIVQGKAALARSDTFLTVAEVSEGLPLNNCKVSASSALTIISSVIGVLGTCGAVGILCSKLAILYLNVPLAATCSIVAGVCSAGATLAAKYIYQKFLNYCACGPSKDGTCHLDTGLCEPPDCNDENSCTTDSYSQVEGCSHRPVQCPSGYTCSPEFGFCKLDIPCLSNLTLCEAPDKCVTGICAPVPDPEADANGCVWTGKQCPPDSFAGCIPATGECGICCTFAEYTCGEPWTEGQSCAVFPDFASCEAASVCGHSLENWAAGDCSQFEVQGICQ